MGGKSRGMSAEEKEAQRLQNERLKQERQLQERQKKEAQSLMKARRSGGAQGSLISGQESGTKGGYQSLLGG